MTIRPFDWRDLPALYRCKNKSVYLHSSLVLTWGPMLVSGALLSSLAPSMGLCTSVSHPDSAADDLIIGQTIHPPGSQNAHLTFLAPDKSLQSPALTSLLEFLSSQAVERGAFRLLAEADELVPVYEMLRRWGFAIYARQRIWLIQEMPARNSGRQGTGAWRPAEDRDLIPVRSLYNNIIPGLVQQVEPFPAERLKGYVYCQGDVVQAYVELKYGRQGIWVQPFVHPDAATVPAHLVDLLRRLPNRLSRPFYVCVRSYQSWLELVIDDLGGQPGPRQAMMVKHLAVPQKAVRAFALPALEGGRPEVSAPFSRSVASPQAADHRAEAQLENHNS